MTNEERYKTADERMEAFYRYCHNQECSNISAECKHENCVLEWLELETDDVVEEILPCPFCGGKCRLYSFGPRVICDSLGCSYQSGTYSTNGDAISSHNQVARAVIESKEKCND